MSYAMLVERIRSLPNDCLEEISLYIDFMLYCKQRNHEGTASHDTEDYLAA